MKKIFLLKTNRKRAGTIVAICCNLACLLSALLAPFMPSTSKELRSQLGLSNKSYGYIPETITNMLPTWHKIGKPSPLFTKIDDQKVEMLRKKYAGQQNTNGTSTDKASDESVASLEAAITKQVSKSFLSVYENYFLTFFCIFQGNLVRELKVKNDKSWRDELEVLLNLKKKLIDLKSSASDTNAPEKKLSPKNRKAEPTHVPEQNGDALTDVAALQMAIAKQVLDIVKTFLMIIIHSIIMRSIYTICCITLGYSCARIKSQGRRKCVETTSGDIIETKTAFNGSHWNSTSRC